MKGGSIESNQAENLGRAMFISGTFNWTGGTITGHGGAFNDILYNPGGGHINNNTNPHQEPS